MPKELTLSEQETQHLVNYLLTKPYAEVYQMINLITQRTQSVQIPKPPVEDQGKEKPKK